MPAGRQRDHEPTGSSPAPRKLAVIDGYETAARHRPRFDLLIDWGWFYFITKPMFFVIDWFFRLFGNFGLAILAVTVVVKLVFFPLANKSYQSMSAMKKVQPQMAALRERFKDDKVKQQQALMELYKKREDQSARRLLADGAADPGLLLALQGAVRHHRDAPRAVLRLDPGPVGARSDEPLQPLRPDPVDRRPLAFLMIGIWPLIMGVTMFVQMRLNPTPPDPTQQMIFTCMPMIFTFMLASFPAGLVIYWAWNNTLSVMQQSVIMKRQGVKVELWDNIVGTFKRKPKRRTPRLARIGRRLRTRTG